MMKRILLLLALLLIIVATAFLTLDFRLQQAELQVDSESSAYSFGHAQDETPLSLEQELDLYVEAPLDLEEELVGALREELATNPYVGEIYVREASPAAGADSMLLLEVDEPSILFWSPFYTRTDMNVDVAYASDGEVEWIDEDVVHLESGELSSEPVFRTRAEFEFDGSAYGLISGPAYAHYLAQEVAHYVNQSLADAIVNQVGSR